MTCRTAIRAPTLVGTATPEGYVVRRKWAHAEDAYRWSGDGQWQRAVGHNGAWFTSNGALVPADVLHMVSEYQKSVT